MAAICKTCNKKNHFDSVCESKKLTKSVKAVDKEENQDENTDPGSYIYNNLVEASTVIQLDSVNTPAHAINAKKQYPDTMVMVKFGGGTKMKMQIDRCRCKYN